MIDSHPQHLSDKSQQHLLRLSVTSLQGLTQTALTLSMCWKLSMVGDMHVFKEIQAFMISWTSSTLLRCSVSKGGHLLFDKYMILQMFSNVRAVCELNTSPPPHAAVLR